MSKNVESIEPHVDASIAGFLLGGMSKRWVLDRVKAGEFTGVLLGNKTVITVASINSFLRARTIRAKSK
jgi:hypothetical protein